MSRELYEKIYTKYKNSVLKLNEENMARYKCKPCGWVYDPKDHGGKPFSEWSGPCPKCGAPKSKFVKLGGVSEEKDMKKIHDAIAKFLKNNPTPSDDEVHALADKMGIDTHEFEEHVYMMLGSELKESKNNNEGFHVDIEKETLDNDNYRKVLKTTNEMQLVVMSIKPGEEIGMETHENGSQFIRIEGGTGESIMGDKKVKIKDGSSLTIPSGVNHNVINTGNDDLKLYAVYAPPEHEDGLVQETK